MTITFTPVESSSSPNVETLNISASNFHAPQRRSEEIVSSGTSEAVISSNRMAGNKAADTIPLDRIYPHYYDETEAAGKAIRLLTQARDDVDDALEAFGLPDLERVGSRLTIVSAICAKAEGLVDLNADLNGAIAFVRRATLCAQANDVTRPSLNSLARALTYLIEHPTLDLMQAAALANELEGQGWKGQLQSLEDLLHGLFIEGADEEEGQAELFASLEKTIEI